MSPGAAHVTVDIEGLPVWLRTMTASIDLLVAVEDADQALLPDDVAAAAGELRRVIDDEVAGR